MYKNKYLKYKKKYLQCKLQYGGNDKYVNYAVKRFGIEVCLENLHYFFSNYNFPNITRLSIGSGNAFLEHLYKETYRGEPDIICIDPEPLSFRSTDLVEPFIQPAYPTVVEFKAANPTAETVLFINWPGPEPENTYDIDAIKLLKPVAFFIIYAKRKHEDDTTPRAGSNELISFIDEFIHNRTVDLEDQLYLKVSEWKGKDSNLCIDWYINRTKHQDRSHSNYYYDTDIWKDKPSVHTVDLKP